MVGKINKRGQITIFIIVGILIVVAVIMVLILYDRTKLVPMPSPGEDPGSYLEQCINQYIETAVNKLMQTGGYIEQPELVKSYLGEKITYLCYTERNYARCVAQEPVLTEHLEQEIYKYIEPKISLCFNNLKTGLENDGYSVNFENQISFDVELIPGAVKVPIQRKITISKTNPQKFNEFEAKLQTPIYDLFEIAKEIIRQEILWCNSKYDEIMMANTWAEITKFQTGDDNKIYTIKDTRTEKQIKFAIKNCVLSTPS